MDELRWSLLILGVALIVGIYIWDRVRRRRRRSPGKDLDTTDEALLEGLAAGQEPVDDDSVREALGQLSGLRGDRNASEDLDLDELRAVVPAALEPAADADGEGGGSSEEGEPAPVYSVEPPQSSGGQELIVVLNVMAESGQEFAGKELRQALEDLDLRYGDMQVFHHFGVDEMSVDAPVFSVANVLEPGVFDPEQIEELATPGLCVFMRLPGPLDGRVAFELMLSTGQRLAERLGGELRDDTRSVLSPQRIGNIRERIAEFERQGLVPAE